MLLTYCILSVDSLIISLFSSGKMFCPVPRFCLSHNLGKSNHDPFLPPNEIENNNIFQNVSGYIPNGDGTVRIVNCVKHSQINVINGMRRNETVSVFSISFKEIWNKLREYLEWLVCENLLAC